MIANAIEALAHQPALRVDEFPGTRHEREFYAR
jgi:hypothetical protein